MDFDLSGKLALVTGSTRGIGLASAVGLARMGAAVIVNGRGQEAVSDAITKIRQAVGEATLHGAAADLAGASGCATIIDAFPSVDILVNNMGIYEPKPFFEIPDEDWQLMFDTNVMSGVCLTRHYLSTPRIGAGSSSSPASRASSSRRRWCTTDFRRPPSWWLPVAQRNTPKRPTSR